MTITRNYNDRPMTGLTEHGYWTLVHHLSEQLLACMDRDAYPEGEAEKCVADALNNEWHEELSVREWLAKVGKSLGVNTTDCVGT